LFDWLRKPKKYGTITVSCTQEEIAQRVTEIEKKYKNPKCTVVKTDNIHIFSIIVTYEIDESNDSNIPK